MSTENKQFDEAHVLHELKHYLPEQTPLKDFIHHNSLHALQHLDFYDAIFTAADMFGIKPTLSLDEYRKLFEVGRIRPQILEQLITARKGEKEMLIWKDRLLLQSYDASKGTRVGMLRAFWKKIYHIDLDNLVQPLLFRIICSYLDQGIALWHFPFESAGLLNAVRELEKKSFSGFFKTKRARKLLFEPDLSLQDLLAIVVGEQELYEQYLFDQQFSHRGWSGMVAAIEAKPETILYPKKVSLRDFIMLELLMEIDALDHELGKKWKPLATVAGFKRQDLFARAAITEMHEVLMLWQDAFEWSYYDEVLYGVQQLKLAEKPEEPGKKEFQAIFCIDERECSLRRYLEATEPACETLGWPGFFGVEFFFHPANGKFYEKLCPVPVTPKHLIKETESDHKREQEVLFTKRSHTALQGFFVTLSLGLWAALRLTRNLFRPQMEPAISNAFEHMNLHAALLIEAAEKPEIENGLQVGFTVIEMADRVEALLKGIGLSKGFAPLVYLVAHGSSSANNPHHGAYDCGACSGRPGSVNARVFAFMANHPRVRALLSERGVEIPDDTQFVGALHDTAREEIAFFDEDVLTGPNIARHVHNKQTFERALDLNAKERSRRFASIDHTADIRQVREAIRKRAVSYFEPRPELGHGTNALCFVGSRKLTKGLFLDRRAFMNSYDYKSDPEGKLLPAVMRPLPLVCGGINLEYYFSRVDNQKMGAGTKLPHNVMGLIGVSNSSDGDLRPGLSLQMIEVHDPVRLMLLVEHYPEVVLKTIQTDPELHEWFFNGWMHLVAIHPDTNNFFYFKKGNFTEYKPLAETAGIAHDTDQLIENSKGMKTNEIFDSTMENLPVHLLK
jgi:uncharacterized protein YbcC (UPF0753/DUF2309 family)